MIKRKISAMLIMSLIFFSCQQALSQSPYIEFSDNKVWAKDIDQEVLFTFCRYYNNQNEWKSIFPVTTLEAEGKIEIDGHYEVYTSSISFTPRFPFVAGVPYVAHFRLEELASNFNEIYLPKINGNNLKLLFSIVRKESHAPGVVAVYPSADVVPENLLKFHIAFTTSMTLGEVYKRVKLIDSKNNIMEKPFLILDQELWDPEMKMVTVLLDPGRIKRGLKANLEMDAPLKAGETYTLVIEPGWKNFNGDVTIDTFRKQFTCTVADRMRPNVEDWKLISPKSSTDPLIIELKENFDKVLLTNGMKVLDSFGNRIPGKTLLLNHESSFVFQPVHGWSAEKYTICINPSLEDLSGNNLNRLFDEDLSHGVSDRNSAKEVPCFFQ